MPEPNQNAGEGRTSGDAFRELLSALDTDRELAAEKYLELCYRLRKLFAWKGCPSSDLDDLVDRTLDRVARKLGQGETIENVSAYATGVAKKVWLEHVRPKPPILAPASEPLADEPGEEGESRLDCLDECLAKLPAQDREIILGYYDVEENEKNKDNRRRLAERLGKSGGALKVSANRLRERLRKCVEDCLRRKGL